MMENTTAMDPLSCAWDTIYNELQWALGDPSLRSHSTRQGCYLTFWGGGTTIHSRIITYLLDHLKEVADQLKCCHGEELVLKTCNHWDNYRKGIDRVKDLLVLLDDLPVEALSRAGDRRRPSRVGDRWTYCTESKGPMYNTCMKLCVELVMGERFVLTVFDMMEEGETATPGVLGRAIAILDQLVPYNFRLLLKSYIKRICKAESQEKLSTLGVVRYMRQVKNRVATEVERMNRWYVGFEMETERLVKYEMLTAHKGEIEKRLKPTIVVLMNKGSSQELKRICYMLRDLDWGMQLMSSTVIAHLKRDLKQTANLLKDCKGENFVIQTCTHWDRHKDNIEKIRDFLSYLDDIPLHKYFRMCGKRASEPMHSTCLRLFVDVIMGKRFVFSVLSLMDKGKSVVVGLLKDAIRVLDEIVAFDFLPELRNYTRKVCSKEAQQSLSRLSAVQYARQVKWREAKELQRMERWYPTRGKEMVGIVRYVMLTIHRSQIKEKWPSVMVELIDSGQYQNLRHMCCVLGSLDWGLQCVLDTLQSHLMDDLSACENTIVSSNKGDPLSSLQAVWDKYANVIARVFGDSYDLWRRLFTAYRSCMLRLIRKMRLTEQDAHSCVQKLLRVYPFLCDDPWGQNLPDDLIIKIRALVQSESIKDHANLSKVNSHWCGKPHIIWLQTQSFAGHSNVSVGHSVSTTQCLAGPSNDSVVQSLSTTKKLAEPSNDSVGKSVSTVQSSKKSVIKQPEPSRAEASTETMQLKGPVAKGSNQAQSGLHALKNHKGRSIQQRTAGKTAVACRSLPARRPVPNRRPTPASRPPWRY